MESERWARVAALFEAVQEIDESKRADYLTHECGEDRELRQQVEALLGEQDANPDFLENPTHLAHAPSSTDDVSNQDTVMPGQASRPAMPGNIGSYKVLGRIGEGGMGIVYRVEQQHPRRIAALKIVKPGVVSDETLRRFDHECLVLGRLQHPGIAQIFESGTEDFGLGPQPYFAMEYIEGAPLDEYAEQQRLDLRQRVELIARVCDAVHHAHQKGIIHRDLKPGNILVDSTGQPKILDFGVARATDADLQLTTMQTQVGQLIGTVQYMSPEQAAGNPEKIDTRSDVYSLGVILYQLLSGCLPHDFEGRMFHEAVRIVAEEEAQPLSVVSRYRGDVETITAKSLALEKDRRYASAQELSDDIRRYLRDETILARPASAIYQLRKFARRNRALVGGVVAFMLLLVVAATVSAGLAVKATRNAETAQQRLRQVREIALEFIEQDGMIKNLLGSTKARQSLVETSLEVLEGLADESEGEQDPELLAEVATARIRVGDVQGNVYEQNLGDPRGALKNYLLSLEIRDQLLEREPSIEHRRDLARSHKRVATVLHSLGNQARAKQHCLEAIELLEPHGSHPACTRDLAILYDRRGDIEAAQRQSKPAFDSYTKSLALWEELDPESEDQKNEQQRARHTIGLKIMKTLALLGKTKDALARAEAIIESATAFRDANSKNMDAQRILAVCYNHYAWLLRGLRRSKEQVHYLTENNRICRELHEGDGANLQAHRDLAVSHQELGRALPPGESEAEHNLNLALDLFRELYEGDPVSREARRALRECWLHRIDLHRRRNELRPRLDALDELRALIERHSPEDQEAEDLWHYASWHQKLATAKMQLGEFESARTHFESAQELLQEVESARPDDLDLKKDIVGNLCSFAALDFNRIETAESDLEKQRLADSALVAVQKALARIEADPFPRRLSYQARRLKGLRTKCLENSTRDSTNQ